MSHTRIVELSRAGNVGKVLQCINRRLRSHSIAIVAVLCSLGTNFAQTQETESTAVGELLSPVQLPQQVVAKEGHLKVAGARLWYWDTGGEGEPVVLVHPATGSGLIWGYQQPVFSKAGYRVIGYSRKNHANSAITSPNHIASEVDDLHRLVDTLGIDRFHSVGLGAGGGIVMQYSVAHPKKLLSMTVACSLGSVKDEDYYRASSTLRPTSFYSLPPEFRELGPCYRAANPAGTQRWIELTKKSRSNDRFLSGPREPAEVTWEKLKADKIPTLLLGGDADLYMPPPMLKYFHDRMPSSEMVVVQGSGHSAYWEQPEQFNRAVLDFLGRHAR